MNLRRATRKLIAGDPSPFFLVSNCHMDFPFHLALICLRPFSRSLTSLVLMTERQVNCQDLLDERQSKHSCKLLVPFYMHFCSTDILSVATAMLCASQAPSPSTVSFLRCQSPLRPLKLCVLFFDLSIHLSGHRNTSFELSSFQMPALFTALPTSAEGSAAFPCTERHCKEGMD